MARSKDDFVFLLHHVFIQPNVYCQVKFSQYFDPSLTLFGIRMYSNHSLDKRRTLIINGKNPFFILNVFHIAFLPFIHTCTNVDTIISVMPIDVLKLDMYLYNVFLF